MMAVTSQKNETNPIIISATGYAPYIELRAKQAECHGKKKTGFERRAEEIRDFWRREHFQEDITNYAKQHEINLLRNQWECTSDKRTLFSRVRWRMGQVKDKLNEDLENRRNKLSELLREEDEMYRKEISLSVREDPEEQQQRLLARYEHLKAEKEKERQEIVMEKEEQLFKRNCEELRSLLSKKIHDETVVEGKRIIQEKEEESKQKNREEKFYEEMWRKDIEAKKLKEEKEQEEKRKKSFFNNKDIINQMEQKKLDKIKKLKEKEYEAEIMAEQKRLLELEEECKKEEKKKKQLEMKNNLDDCLRENLKQRAKEIQEDLGQQMSFLEKIMQGEEDEAKQTQKKKALMKEQQEYFEYLKGQMNKELEFEKQVDRLYEEELDRIWKKRQAEWEEERSKRRQLQRTVIEGVKEQIQANSEKNKLLYTLNQEYAQKVLEVDVEDKKRDAEKLKLIREKNAEYQQELLAQIRSKERELEEEKRQKELELKELQRLREAEEAKIENLLFDMKLDNEHPYRVCRRELFNDCGD